MARQLGLKRDELVQLVECPLSRDEYGTLLRERGKLWSHRHRQRRQARWPGLSRPWCPLFGGLARAVASLV